MLSITLTTYKTHVISAALPVKKAQPSPKRARNTHGFDFVKKPMGRARAENLRPVNFGPSLENTVPPSPGLARHAY